MFGRKSAKRSQNGIQKMTYDKERERPILKCSICNGEQVAGFKDIHTGKFREIMLIQDDKDLEMFLEIYDLTTVAKEY